MSLMAHCIRSLLDVNTLELDLRRSRLEDLCCRLNATGLFQILESHILSLLYSLVEERVQSKCKSVYEEPMLDDVLAWLRHDVHSVIALLNSFQSAPFDSER